MKQEDRFFRLMHAVDDDLLEEAMQPVRRRRHVWIPLAAAACLCIAAALAAVPLLRAPARQDVQPDGTQKQSGTSATEAAVPSSVTTDAKAIMDLGYTLAVPADSQDVVYSLVPTDSDIPMAQPSRPGYRRACMPRGWGQSARDPHRPQGRPCALCRRQVPGGAA